MFRDDRVVAVLDWEMAFLGDPEADLAWWCFLDWANNEGYGGPHLDGIPGKEETLARYAEITGHPRRARALARGVRGASATA